MIIVVLVARATHLLIQYGAEEKIPDLVYVALCYSYLHVFRIRCKCLV